MSILGSTFGGLPLEKMTEYAIYVIDHIDQYIPISTSVQLKWIYEDIEHDDYDEIGPKSNIYYMFIIIYDMKKKMYMCFVLTAEKWYKKGEIVKYDKFATYMSNNFSPVKDFNDLHRNYIRFVE
jgi:hypothetical protein